MATYNFRVDPPMKYKDKIAKESGRRYEVKEMSQHTINNEECWLIRYEDNTEMLRPLSMIMKDKDIK